MAKTIYLNVSQVFDALPQDLNTNPQSNGIAFSFHDDNYAISAPAYRNQNELACWFAGYLAALANIEEKEN